MANKLEVELYNVIRNVNDLTKSNIATAIQTAMAAGTLVLDEYAAKNVISLVSATVDQSLDVMHMQTVNAANANNATTRKKPTGRKTTKKD